MAPDPHPTRTLPRPPAAPTPRAARPPRRVVLLGAVVVLLAGALGVLLGTLGVGAAGTSAPQPPEPPAAASPPAASASPSAAAIPDEVAALVATLPASVYRDCAPRKSDDSAGQVASVRCVPATPGADELLVTQWRDRDAMDADFARYTRYPDGKCSQTTGVRSTWDGGRLACYVNDNDHAVVMCEYDEHAVQVFAVRTDGRHEPLYDWWLTAAKTPLR